MSLKNCLYTQSSTCGCAYIYRCGFEFNYSPYITLLLLYDIDCTLKSGADRIPRALDIQSSPLADWWCVSGRDGDDELDYFTCPACTRVKCQMWPFKGRLSLHVKMRRCYHSHTDREEREVRGHRVWFYTLSVLSLICVQCEWENQYLSSAPCPCRLPCDINHIKWTCDREGSETLALTDYCFVL